ncbi:MAG TPA: glycosyltransferase family 4 protein [Clostridiaceae bacterium]|nr:glycosyltransferase family 4 protein [Clostridiaceae bacterium]
MLNVLHLINYPGKGGSEKYILSLVEKLQDKNCKFYICHSEDGPMLESAKKLGAEVINLKMRSPYDFKAALELKKLCKKLSIDIVHTHFLRENCIAALSKFLGNRVVLVNTYHLIGDENILLRLFNSLLTAVTDRIIAVSNAVKKKIASECINSRKIKVIHNGVDIEYWKGERDLKVRDELGVNRNAFMVTSIARFSEEKGHIFYLESIKEFKKLYYQDGRKNTGDVKFVLVGDGEMLDECINFADMLGLSEDVIFTGYRLDVKDILHGSDLFVSHSKSEALGISILEALACSVPVIATDAGGPSEIISENNDCGMIVEYGDTEGMAKSILKFINDKSFYDSCRENALKTVRAKFSLDKTVEETFNLYILSLSPGYA